MNNLGSNLMEKDSVYKENGLETEDICNRECSKVVKITSGLDVEVDPRDKVINLIPGKLQFFTFSIVKATGEVKIKPKNKCENKIISGNLADYKIFANGILVNAYKNLNYLRNDILIFTVVDECTKKEQDFAVVFGYRARSCSCSR